MAFTRKDVLFRDLSLALEKMKQNSHKILQHASQYYSNQPVNAQIIPICDIWKDLFEADCVMNIDESANESLKQLT